VVADVEKKTDQTKRDPLEKRMHLFLEGSSGNFGETAADLLEKEVGVLKTTFGEGVILEDEIEGGRSRGAGRSSAVIKSECD